MEFAFIALLASLAFLAFTVMVYIPIAIIHHTVMSVRKMKIEAHMLKSQEEKMGGK